ncbi:MAG: hypothetical protein HYR91_12375 [Flavobacteriia bacterium]|nr:hypothetical protein [Flavobacteriia bacterium]
MSIIINLLGEGIRYWICDIPIHRFNEFEKIKERNNLDWETMLFDFDFLKHFGYSHWSELSNKKDLNGFLVNSTNKIEIKERKKILLKMPIINILNQSSLFDLYSTKKIHFNFKMKKNMKTIILVQKEIGLIGKFQINSSSFKIDKLEFEITLNNYPFFEMIVSKFKYENKILKINSEDLLVKSLNVTII